MATEDQVAAAYADYERVQDAVVQARERYRAVLRAYLAEAGRGGQAALSRRLGRTREMLRLDAKPE